MLRGIDADQQIPRSPLPPETRTVTGRTDELRSARNRAPRLNGKLRHCPSLLRAKPSSKREPVCGTGNGPLGACLSMEVGHT
jgi:hypothetical protein